MREGAGFAVAVLVIMLAEQTLINAAVLTVDATAADAALAGFVFNVAADRARAAAALPGDPGLAPPPPPGLGRGGPAEFAHAIRVTVLAIAAFAGAVALGLLPSGRGRWTCSSTATSATGAAGSRWSASAWACT